MMPTDNDMVNFLRIYTGFMRQLWVVKFVGLCEKNVKIGVKKREKLPKGELMQGRTSAWMESATHMGVHTRVSWGWSAAERSWNPTLMFVMGGALGVMAPFMLLVVRPGRLAAKHLQRQILTS